MPYYYATVEKNFKNISGILEFELLNEPWPGNIYNNSNLIQPGVADKENLTPFYDSIVKNIYENDDERKYAETSTSVYSTNYFELEILLPLQMCFLVFHPFHIQGLH